MFRHLVLSVFTFGCFSVNSVVYAEDFLDLLDQENEVFAASRYVQSLEETPASVSVITREEIDQFGYYSLEQAILSLPGVHNASNLAWPMFGIRGVAKPGDICSRFLILLNGLPATYDPVFGGTCFQLIDLESLKRIEFVRGPGSAVYGSGASLGVINLITRDGSDESGLHISTRASSQKEAQLYAAWGGHVGEIQGFLSISGKNRKGLDYHFPDWISDYPSGLSSGNDGQQLYRTFGRLGRGNTWFQWRYEWNVKNDPQARFGTTFNSDQMIFDDRSLSVDLTSMHDVAHDAKLIWRLYATKFNELGYYPYGDFGTSDRTIVQTIYSDNIETIQYGGEIRYDAFLMGGQHLVAGTDIRYVSGRQYGGEKNAPIDHDFKEIYGQASLYAQDEISVGINGRLTLGGRLDYYRSHAPKVDYRFNPRAAYIHRVNSDLTTKLVYGEAYRVPTQYELFYDDGGSTKSANLDLKPEIVRTLEAITEYVPIKELKTSVNGYLTRLEDGIVVDDSGGLAIYQNVGGYQQVIGVETSAEWKRDNGFLSYMSFTAQKGAQYPNKAEIAASPQWLAKVGASQPLPSRHWSIATEAQYVDATEGVIDTSGNRLTGVPAYWLLDISIVGKEFIRGLLLTARVDNVFDNDAYTVADIGFDPIKRVPLIGRTYSIKLAWSL